MLLKLASIAKNTFVETLRQPVYAIIIISALLMFFISPSLAMCTIDDDNKLLRELGLSTLFLSGLFIAIFAASAAVTEEIDRKTIVTVLSKPVPRPIFILGKFLGVAGAVILAHCLLTITFLMTMRHGVLQTGSDTHDMTVIASAAVIAIVTILITAFLNFSYDWKFSSTAVVLAAMISAIAIAFLALIDRDWQFNPQNNNIAIFDVYASILLLMAVICLVAVAIMFSTRLNIILTLVSCVGVFLMGLTSDWFFGKLAQTSILGKIGRSLVPNLQVFWIADAIYEKGDVSLHYILTSASYGAVYTVAVLLLAIVFFQTRQVG